MKLYDNLTTEGSSNVLGLKDNVKKDVEKQLQALDEFGINSNYRNHLIYKLMTWNPSNEHQHSKLLNGGFESVVDGRELGSESKLQNTKSTPFDFSIVPRVFDLDTAQVNAWNNGKQNFNGKEHQNFNAMIGSIRPVFSKAGKFQSPWRFKGKQVLI